MSVATCSTVVGVFHERSDADKAIDDLVQAGFRNDQIGVVTRDPQGKTVVKNTGRAETQTFNGAIAGALTGAGIGALAGLGVLGAVIPVIGPAIAGGTVATILTNAAAGAAIAGLFGALIGRRFVTARAKYYGSQLQAGRVAVTVRAEDRCDKARTILERHGGYNPESVATTSTRMSEMKNRRGQLTWRFNSIKRNNQ